LLASIRTADSENIKVLPAIVEFLYNNIPLGCWGSWEKVRKWLEG